jgi:predicted phage terminase large subunit-like protein|tara:strand:- start:278 stop:1543 length:1266 start_codon:yes stop_codon:yes gene_type:complete
LELDIKLLPWQQEVWADETRFKVIAAGRRCGKSLYAAYRLLVEALQAEKGHVFYVAQTQGQARDVMWSVLMDIGRPVVKQAHINNLQLTLINGATISLKGSDRPDTMRGVSLKFVVLDEYAGMKPSVWEEVLRPALADQKGHAVFIGTPTGRNHFWDLYQYAELSGDEDWKAWHLTSYDNPILDPEEINAAKKSMSSFAFRQEFLAKFEAKDSELFREEWLQFREEPCGKPLSGHDYYIACDLAGFEDVGGKTTKSRLDETAIAVVGVNPEGDWFVHEIVHGRWDLNETANRIFKVVQNYKPRSVGIEKGIAQQAVMSPLTDLQRKLNRYFRIELLSHGNKKKTDRVVWALQGLMENKRITLNVGEWNSTFMDQLFQFPSRLTHDDLIDALAYIEQLSQPAYGAAIDDLEGWEPIDDLTGY